MGKVYRRKRRSCAMCKPNKTGGAPARTAKERAKEAAADREIRAVMTKLLRSALEDSAR